MRREFKPGDVAMARNANGDETNACVAIYQYGGRWQCAHGELIADLTPTRPLLVIDPEDREQVERVISEYVHAFATRRPDVASGAWGEAHADSMQAALRSLIEPPKPEEPTGWLARAEDAAGFVYVRIYERGAFPWSLVINSVGNGRRADTDKNYSWSELDIVRILSGGQP